MAALAYSIEGAEVFSSREQRSIGSARGRASADALTRPDRYTTTMPSVERPVIKLEVMLGGPLIELTYCGEVLPEWADTVIRSLPTRWGSDRGWDGYRALPTNPKLVAKLLNILSLVMLDDYVAPQIIPLADGGMQAEWHRNGRDLEIVVSAVNAPSYFFFDQALGHEAESVLEAHEDDVRRLIAMLS